ncbi:hypothetical protein AAZX31_08G240400 [Glycine max]
MNPNFFYLFLNVHVILNSSEPQKLPKPRNEINKTKLTPPLTQKNQHHHNLLPNTIESFKSKLSRNSGCASSTMYVKISTTVGG